MPKPLNKPTSLHDTINSASMAAEAAGIYTWVISTDTVYSDALVADAFGFDYSQARCGLPLKDFLSRIHPEDLPRVAKAIRETMVTSMAFSEQYRTCRPDGSVTDILAFGSCFRDESGEPSHYSGIIMPIGVASCSESTILTHLVAAHDLAKNDGRLDLADKIVDALVEVGWRENDAKALDGVRHHH